MAGILVNVDSGEVPGRTKEEKEQTLAYWYEFNLDRYYALIEPYTFPTVFVEFSKEEGQAWLLVGAGKQLSLEQHKAFDGLLERLDAAIKRFPSAFVKLSTRSPKDSVDKDPQRLLPILAKHLKTAEQTPNGTLLALRRSFLEVMAVKDAKEALSILQLSARIISDIRRGLEHSNWDLHWVVREYRSLPVDSEFKGFVYNKQLNALTQYDSQAFYNELPGKIDRIAMQIQEFHNKVKDVIPMSAYIVDFCVIDDNEIKIVELNPFTEHTGSGLFSWKDDETIIKEGPFECRIRKAPLPDKTLSALQSNWRHLVDKALDQV
eukprot:TRINITY_DN3610_c0_g1_i1.p1 TRINITY_DN3610_c0_g1~~TRINITY_DN3610_c0_g1_i1.p1  ORF type:complete len:320 (+),score=67.86 TRINITY_DN3610_c0_g1_i1:55-1014(+)